MPSIASFDFDDYVPMVDKTVDAEWKNKISEASSTDDTPKFHGIRAQIMTMLVAFILMVVNMLRSVTINRIKKLLNSNLEGSHFSLLSKLYPAERGSQGHPPTSEVELFSSVLGRLGKLEEKVDILQAKPSEMPYEKEELLIAASHRVDALEAELIATKKILHEALIRQEELLAYIDGQQEGKFRKKLCF